MVIFFSVTDKAVKEYNVYKPYLGYFAMLDALPNIQFQVKKNIYLLTSSEQPCEFPA